MLFLLHGGVFVNSELFERIGRRIDSYQQAMIDLQIALTAIPALGPENGGDGEHRKAAFLTEYLGRSGFVDVRQFPSPDGRVSSGARPNIVVVVPAADSAAEDTAWILTHTDIVPPGDANLWDTDPYEVRLKEDRIYGRGVEDNQQDLVAALFAAKAFLDEGIKPSRNIGLAFVADEETSSRWGLAYLLAHPQNPFRKTDLIVVPDGGNEEGSLIEIAEKSILWLRVHTRGKQCHASRPSQGRNAFAAASHLIAKLDRLPGLFPLRDPLFDPPASTFEATKKESNVPNINTLPGDDVFYLDCRVLPAYFLPDVLAAIREMADEIEAEREVSIDLVPVQMGQAPEPTSPGTPVVKALRRAVGDVYGIEARVGGVGGGTVAAYFRRESYAAAVWSRLATTAHQPNEYCLIKNMLGNAKVFAHLFLQESGDDA